MREFEIDEISAVDRPAQQGAKMAIMKRDASEEEYPEFAKRWIDPADGAVSVSYVLQQNMEEKKYYEMMERFGPAISAVETSLRSILGDKNLEAAEKLSQTRNAVEEFMAVIRGKVSDGDAAKVAKALGLDVEAEGGSDMSTKDEATVEALTAKVADLTKQLEAAKATDAGKAAELQTKLDEANKSIEDMKAELATAKAEAALSAEEKSFADTLKGDDRKGFLAMSTDDRKKKMNKAASEDETLTIAGHTVKKSEVGATQFSIFKNQAEALAKAEEAAAKAEDARVTTEVTKRVEDNLNELPGKVEEKVVALKAISKLDKAAQDTLNAMLEAGNKAMKAAFDTVGSKRERTEKTGADFEKRINEIAKRDNIGRVEATQKARREYPEEFAAYQSNGEAN